MKPIYPYRCESLNSSSGYRSLLILALLRARVSSLSYRIRAELHSFARRSHCNFHPESAGTNYLREHIYTPATNSYSSQLAQLQAFFNPITAFTSTSQLPHLHRTANLGNHQEITLLRYLRPISTCIARQATSLQLCPSNFTNIASLLTSAASTIIHTNQLQTDTMAKESPECSDSSLSPVPGNLEVPVETGLSAKATTNGRKRKAETTLKTTAETAKRTRKTVADNIKEKQDVIVGTAETPRKTRTTTKKAKYEEDADDKVGSADREETTIVEKTIRKRATQTKKSKGPAPALEKRTIDTKLRIGAHVSVAGG